MRRALTAVAVLVIAGFAVVRMQREREWAHGGDRLTAHAEVALATDDTFEAVAVRLGVPPGQATRLHDADQSVVVRVRWSGSEHSDGSYQLIVLDGRVTPPRPLAADGGWNAEGGTGSNWAGAYGVLAERYDWLRRAGDNDGTTAAVHAPGAETGTVTAWFRQPGEGTARFTDARRDIVVAWVRVDDGGEVRWARRL